MHIFKGSHSIYNDYKKLKGKKKKKVPQLCRKTGRKIKIALFFSKRND